MIRVVASLGGHQRLWGICARCMEEGILQDTGVLRLQSGGPQGRREGPPGDERELGNLDGGSGWSTSGV